MSIGVVAYHFTHISARYRDGAPPQKQLHTSSQVVAATLVDDDEASCRRSTATAAATATTTAAAVALDAPLECRRALVSRRARIREPQRPPLAAQSSLARIPLQRRLASNDNYERLCGGGGGWRRQLRSGGGGARSRRSLATFDRRVAAAATTTTATAIKSMLTRVVVAIHPHLVSSPDARRRL